jgi:hypothetical protein
MNLSDSAIPDLLRRFAPATHELCVWVDGIAVTLRSNDARIVSALHKAGTRDGWVRPAHSVLVKVIRDEDASIDQSNVTVVTSWPLVTILRGPGTMICLDCERREILGFVAPDVSAEEFVSQLLPLALEHLRRETLAASAATGDAQ